MSEKGSANIVLIVIAVLAVSLSMFWGMGYNMMGPGTWWGGGYWWMPIIMVLFLVMVALGIYYLLRAISPSGSMVYREDQDRALNIAKERLARGEITLEEFEKMKKSLME